MAVTVGTVVVRVVLLAIAVIVIVLLVIFLICFCKIDVQVLLGRVSASRCVAIL